MDANRQCPGERLFLTEHPSRQREDWLVLAPLRSCPLVLLHQMFVRDQEDDEVSFLESVGPQWSLISLLDLDRRLLWQIHRVIRLLAGVCRVEELCLALVFILLLVRRRPPPWSLG